MSFNPANDRPRNSTQRQIIDIHDRLVDAGFEDEAAPLRLDRGNTITKEARARNLEDEYLTPPTERQQIERALDERDPPEEERGTVESRLQRAEWFDEADTEYADGLRESARALAKYGPPESRADALGDAKTNHAADLLSRAEMVSSIDEEYADELREAARDVVEEPVAAQRDGGADQVAVDRDVTATLEAIIDDDRTSEATTNRSTQDQDSGDGNAGRDGGDAATLSGEDTAVAVALSPDAVRKQIRSLADRAAMLESADEDYAERLRADAAELAGVDDFDEIAERL